MILVSVCVCEDVCSWSESVSAGVCVGVRMQAWKWNAVFFVLKSWFSALEYSTKEKKLTNGKKIRTWPQFSQTCVFVICWFCFVDSRRQKYCRINVFLISFSFFLYLFLILFANSYIYQFNMMAEPGGICILQSFENRLTEEGNNKPWLYVQR